MPVRDAEETLQASLDSLLVETGSDIEFVLVNDGSNDSTLAILDAAAAIDARVVVVDRPRLGLVAALNAGLTVCRGEFVARHDADDLSIAGRLTAQRRFLLANSEIDLVATRCEVFRDDGPAKMGMLRWTEWSNGLETHEAMYRERFVESPFAHPSIMIRAATLRAADGYRLGDFPEDYELWLRLFADGRRFGRLPQLGVRIRDHDRRSIRNQPQYRPEAFRNLKIDHLRREFLQPGEPVLVFGGGPVARSWVTSLQENQVDVAGMVDINPRRIGQIVRDVPVISTRQAVAGYRRVKALGAVGRPGGREDIRASLGELGRREGEDFIFVA